MDLKKLSKSLTNQQFNQLLKLELASSIQSMKAFIQNVIGQDLILTKFYLMIFVGYLLLTLVIWLRKNPEQKATIRWADETFV